MKKAFPSRRRLHRVLALASCLFAMGALIYLFAGRTWIESWLFTLKRGGGRFLGRQTPAFSPEEMRIREEIILKKMEEASSQRDWRDLAPEYPRPEKTDVRDEKEKLLLFKNSQAFKEMDRLLKDYLKRKEDIFSPNLPVPSLREATDLSLPRDRAEEKVISRLLGERREVAADKPIEENVRLGIKGPLVSRKIVERPPLPEARLRTEAELEMILWVLPDGTVDRVIPSLKGDPELERISIQYLMQWRFEPLPKDVPQVEQWGTIPLKFKVH